MIGNELRWKQDLVIYLEVELVREQFGCSGVVLSVLVCFNFELFSLFFVVFLHCSSECLSMSMIVRFQPCSVLGLLFTSYCSVYCSSIDQTQHLYLFIVVIKGYTPTVVSWDSTFPLIRLTLVKPFLYRQQCLFISLNAILTTRLSRLFTRQQTSQPRIALFIN